MKNLFTILFLLGTLNSFAQKKMEPRGLYQSRT